MTLAVALAAAAVATTAVPRSSAATRGPTAEIEKILADQQAAWNRGDLEGYMAGYWRSPELTFYSGATITRGWQATLDRYKKRYQGEGREMGKLTFGAVDVEILGPTVALVRGQWRLDLEKGKGAHGLFSVIVKQVAEGWRVVHDHSSGE